jgi:hypothetical protein
MGAAITFIKKMYSYVPSEKAEEIIAYLARGAIPLALPNS